MVAGGYSEASKKHSIGLPALAFYAILMVVIGGLVAGGWHFIRQRQFAQAKVICETVSGDYRRDIDNFRKLVKSAEPEAALTKQDVDDISSLEALSLAMKVNIEQPAPCSSVATLDDMERLVQQYQQVDEKINANGRIVAESSDAVKRSKAAVDGKRKKALHVQAHSYEFDLPEY
ncbi:hypothetical protein [Bombiscardovia coagulans]|uniref:Uncharacterized protein n=1 Tax=Bombiscardovia coagulans TaxID=686666 RepID=A0A261EQV6_9BIFI|nr:hypothetical protein [Bombiscardovia coagulans]OZG49238.1 hypothetical protein BOCO_1047 [Bombiscardovia coagulans]